MCIRDSSHTPVSSRQPSRKGEHKSDSATSTVLMMSCESRVGEKKAPNPAVIPIMIIGDHTSSSVGRCHRFLADRCSTISVSYTHLRAHETVLDLVCRLLLEKKKH
eukprot:TRINITY_DN27110_c0_g1_i1.p1 TRINITY_DN27110_c0_g1~~TRINITY_DN27110_c0_g1_i1.p1  ORF type:complete len:106 (-),score=51.04 TRINITY_DN27110_c0_g1_i1:33-350(-)